MNLFLFGFKGSGKTHFGKLLAHKMNRLFLDTDELVAALYAKETGHVHKVREIYIALGEIKFRALERQAIQQLNEVKNGVIALGGGIVLDPQNVELLRKLGALVFLQASPEKLKQRIFKDELPAFFDAKNPEHSFWATFRERTPIYQSIPARCVNTDVLDEAGVIAQLNSILLLEEPPDGL